VVVIASVLKAAFVVEGVTAVAPWSAAPAKTSLALGGLPPCMRLKAAALVWQIGGEATDFVFLVMNEPWSRQSPAHQSEVGADASAAAGPRGVQLQAETDALCARRF